MKKTLSILIAAAMLVSSAAYAAPNEEHGENGREKPVRTEQKAEKPEARPEKAEAKPESKPEAAPEKSETKPEVKPEAKPEKTESKPEAIPEKTEIKPEKPEVKPDVKSKEKPSDTADNSDNSEAGDTENTNNETPDSTDAVSGNDNDNAGNTDTEAKDKITKDPEGKPKKSEIPGDGSKPNDEFRKELDEIKKIRKEHKTEASEVINDLRDIFHEAPKEDRKEILGEIAEIKKALKDDSIGMFMRGKHVDFDKYDGVKPEIVKDRTLVPLRAVSETLGAEVEWNDENKTVTVTYNDSIIVVTVDSTTALVNGEEVEIDSPALIKKDRVLVPIRVIAEALGLTVEWDDDSHSVIVDEKEPATPTETEEPMQTETPTETEEPVQTEAPSETEAPTETSAPTEMITE